MTETPPVEPTAIRLTSAVLDPSVTHGVLAQQGTERVLVLPHSPAVAEVIGHITAILGRPPTEMWIGDRAL